MKLYHNAYYVLRHGRSLANESGIVVSWPENGVSGWGLSDGGAADTRARLSAESLRARRLPLEDFTRARTVCFTSDFRRARETAEIFCELYDLDPPRPDHRLRERRFGRLELTSADGYEAIWAEDRRDANHETEGVESVFALAGRLREFVAAVEVEFAQRVVVCVTHGDPGQVLETIFRGLEPQRQRELPHLENAELRRVYP